MATFQELLAKKRAREAARASQRVQAQRRVAQTQIQKLQDRIVQIEDDIRNKRYKGSRGRKIFENRVKARKATIKFIEQSISSGNIPVDIVKQSEAFRADVSKQLRRKRIKSAGLTAGSRFGQIIKATKGVKILSGRISKNFTRVQLTKAKKAAVKIKKLDLSKNQIIKILNSSDPSINVFKAAGVSDIGKSLTKKQRELVISQAGLTEFIPEPLPEFKAGKKPVKVTEKIDNYLRPTAADSIGKSSAKSVGAFLVDVTKGTLGAAQTTTDAVFRTPDDPKGKIARKKIKSIISNIDKVPGALFLAAKGLKNDLQSKNAFRVTRGLLDIGTAFIPVNFGKSAKVANSVSDVKVKSNLATKSGLISTKVEITTVGLTTANKNFIQKAKLRYNPDTKSVVGSLETTIDGKIRKSKVNLLDEPGFYVDKKTGLRVPKSQIKGDNVVIKLKETTIKKDITKPDAIQLKGGAVRTGGLRQVTVKTTQIVEKGKKRAVRTTEKLSDIEVISDLEKKGKLISAQSAKLSKSTTASIKNFTRNTGLTEAQIKNFLKSIDYDKNIIAGLDKRTRLSRALGLRKSSTKLKNFEAFLKDNFQVIKTRKGSIKFQGRLEEINPIFARLGLSKPKLKQGKLITKQLDELKNLPRNIDIPDLRLRIKLVKKIRGLDIISKIFANTLLKIYAKKLKVLVKQKKLTPQKIKKLPVTKKILKQKQVTKKVQKKITKPITRTITKTKTIIKPVKAQGRPITKPVIADKIKLKNLDLDTALPPGYKLAFDFRYRRLNKVREGKIKKPKNLTLKQAIKLIRTTPARSTDLVIVGITKKKDIKEPSLKGFRLKKAGSKVLRLVQTKAIESAQEARAIKAARTARLKKKKTTRKVGGKKR